MEDYLKEEYGVIEDPEFLGSTEQISDYFSDMWIDYLPCGQGFYTDEAKVLVKISDYFYEVIIKAEIGSQKQDRGDRLYWVENIESVTYKEIPKPITKKRYLTEYSLLLTEDEVKKCNKFLSKFKHYFLKESDQFKQNFEKEV